MAWYRTGTISIPSGSKTVTGNGTTFDDTAAGVNPGDMIIVGGQFLEVATVNNATSITTVNASTAAVTNATYQIVTTVQMSNATLAKKVAAAMDRIINGISNWMLVFKGTGKVTISNYDGSTATGLAWPAISGNMDAISGPAADVNVTRSDGTTVTVPNLKSLSDKIGGKLSADNATLRKLFTSAFVNPGDNWSYPGVTTYNNNLWGSPSQWGTVLTLSNQDVSGNGADGRWFSYIQLDTSGNFAVAVNVNNNFFGAYRVWTTKNTTVDGSGFVKRASPIARVCSDISKMPEGFLEGFAPSESGAFNEEAEGITIVKRGEGQYVIRGSAGLSKDGWQVEVPKDVNGNRLCFVGVVDDGVDIVISIFKPALDLDTGGIVAGAAADIPIGRWIDVRLNMPDDSKYKTKVAESESAMNIVDRMGTSDQ